MPEIKSIVADVDPSAAEHLAIERAHQVAMATGASVCLLLSVYQESLTEGALVDNQRIREARQEYLGRLQVWLESRAGELARDGVDVTTEVVWRSPRYESLLAKAEERGADLVIRAARKHSPIPVRRWRRWPPPARMRPCRCW